MTQTDAWLRRWQTNQIGFHQATVDPILISYWSSLELTPGTEVLVPLCGKSLDVQWLLSQGHRVVGIDVSPVALECLLQEGGMGARRRILPTHEEFDANRLRLFCGDFFAIGRMGLALFSAVYDRAAFGAMALEYRDFYAESICAATDACASVLLTVLDYQESETNGPPFAISRDEVNRCFGELFSVREIARTDILERDLRMRARGVSRLHEVSYLLKRFR